MNLAIPPILGGSHGVSKVDTLKSKTCKSIIDLYKTSIHTKGKVQIPNFKSCGSFPIDEKG